MVNLRVAVPELSEQMGGNIDSFLLIDVIL